MDGASFFLGFVIGCAFVLMIVGPAWIAVILKPKPRRW